MSSEVLRIIEALHREKDIDKEIIFQGIEEAISSASRRKYPNMTDITISLDRNTGEISVTTKDGEILAPPELGRIAAQAGKQAITQKIREAENDVIYNEFYQQKHTIINGNVHRYENHALIVNVGKTEGTLPIQEQVEGEYYQPGDRIKAYILDVNKIGHRVKIILSRTHPNFIRCLFELEVPEIEQGTITINQVVREAGHRTKIAVSSHDSNVDCVGACVGIRGARIRSIIEEVNGEKIDIVRWDESPEILIQNALKPAEVSTVELSPYGRRAKAFVTKNQQPLAIGKEGQNVRLAAKLCRWDIDIVTRDNS